jgi:hypothetical protein
VPQHEAEEVIKRVRDKYLGSYDDLTDGQLLQGIQRKYPGSYDDLKLPGVQIAGGLMQQEPTPPPSPVLAQLPPPKAVPSPPEVSPFGHIIGSVVNEAAPALEMLHSIDANDPFTLPKTVAGVAGLLFSITAPLRDLAENIITTAASSGVSLGSEGGVPGEVGLGPLGVKSQDTDLFNPDLVEQNISRLATSLALNDPLPTSLPPIRF